MEQHPANAPESGGPKEEPRAAFFRRFRMLERVDSPFNFFWKNDSPEVEDARHEAYEKFVEWQPGLAALYSGAMHEYDTLKTEKPLGPYRKDALYYNLHPIFHNIIAYNVNRYQFHLFRMKQSLEAAIAKLEKRGFTDLRDFVLFLINDTEESAAAGQ